MARSSVDATNLAHWSPQLRFLAPLRDDLARRQSLFQGVMSLTHHMPTVEPICSFAVKATPHSSARQSTKRQRSWRAGRSSGQPIRSTSEHERFIAHDHPDWRHRRNASGSRCHSTVGVIQHQHSWCSQSKNQ